MQRTIFFASSQAVILFAEAPLPVFVIDLRVCAKRHAHRALKLFV